MKKILSFVLLALVLIGYQNCGKKMDFASNSSGVGISEDTTLQPIEDTSDDDSAEGPDVEYPEEPPTEQIVDHPSNNSQGNDNQNGNSSRSDQVYICILDGSGKSQRLGLSNNQLVTVGSTPLTVCTTKRACLEFVSKKFNVVSAEYRGFCKENKGHSQQVSESEILTLLGFGTQTHVDL
ncbi:MAG: hypothetical protein V4596_00995 [Bdellovibrionota bacterium]